MKQMIESMRKKTTAVKEDVDKYEKDIYNLCTVAISNLEILKEGRIDDLEGRYCRNLKKQLSEETLKYQQVVRKIKKASKDFVREMQNITGEITYHLVKKISASKQRTSAQPEQRASIEENMGSFTNIITKMQSNEKNSLGF